MKVGRERHIVFMSDVSRSEPTSETWLSVMRKLQAEHNCSRRKSVGRCKKLARKRPGDPFGTP